VAMPKPSRFPAGKLPAAVLRSLLRACRPPASSRVVIGPRYGEDAAVIDFGEKYLIAKTDPITFTEERIGWYAVNINANDLATLGARPRWFLATFLFPEEQTTVVDVKRVVRDTLKACRSLGVVFCGGHTEVSPGLDRPLLVGLMLGEVERGKLVRKDRQHPGDLIILTKGVAIEGTAILAREKAALLRQALGAAMLRRAQRLVSNPGISVLLDAQVALKYGKIHAMHDPTEGGLVAALYELAQAGNVGLQVWREKIPVMPETLALAQALNFDPLALLASGALLIVASRATTPRVVRGLHDHGIAAEVIGEILKPNEGITLIEGARRSPLHIPRQDEIARLFARTS
jgi:hydrogenase expression/formation protein HypE